MRKPSGNYLDTHRNMMQFESGKIAHMTKIWNAGLALKELGWA